MSFKLGITADIHADANPNGYAPYQWFWSGETRTDDIGLVRVDAAYTAFESAGCAFVKDIGDIHSYSGSGSMYQWVDNDTLDSVTSNPVFNTDDQVQLAAIVAAMGAYTGDKFFGIGNHEIAAYTADFTDYTDEVSLPAGYVAMSLAGTSFAGYPDTTFYYHDHSCGCRIVYCYSFGSDATDNTAIVAWLNGTAFDTDRPIVFFSHYALHGDYLSGHEAKRAAIRAEIEAAGVQAVIMGHEHPIPHNRPFRVITNGIPYYSLRGNVLGSNADRLNPVASDHAYYIFDVIPFAVYDNVNSLWRANIKITCNYVPKESYGVTSKDDYDHYLIA